MGTQPGDCFVDRAAVRSARIDDKDRRVDLSRHHEGIGDLRGGRCVDDDDLGVQLVDQLAQRSGSEEPRRVGNGEPGGQNAEPLLEWVRLREQARVESSTEQDVAEAGCRGEMELGRDGWSP